MAACKPSVKDTSTQTQLTDPGPSAPSPCTTYSFCVGAASSQSLNLGVVQNVVVPITAAANFSGNLNISVNHPELNAIIGTGPGADVLFSVLPTSLSLSPGETKNVTVTINVKTFSRSFAGEHFHVSASAVGSALVNDNTVMLTVNPLYEVKLTSNGAGSPHVWMGPDNQPVAVGSTIQIRQRTGGTALKFINYDTTVFLPVGGNNDVLHRIHGDAGLPHSAANEGMIAAPQAGQPGPNPYQRQVTTNAAYYCHQHESGAQARNIQFIP